MRRAGAYSRREALDIVSEMDDTHAMDIFEAKFYFSKEEILLFFSLVNNTVLSH